ncbi:hypothetical protein [Pseudomonas guariconensis]|uniref:hypothetical protein n=1 Tax=Pseudomonas guariconensis TaxID=1288410 RepID=UPI0039059A69
MTWIFEPRKFAAKSENWLLHEGYMDSQKARIESALANASSEPSEGTLRSVVDFIATETGIQLTLKELGSILSLYPRSRGQLAVDGWNDGHSELQVELLDMIADFVANTRWPQDLDDVTLQTFMDRLKAAARFLGYSTSSR